MKRNDLLVERIIAELDASLEQLGHWHEEFTRFQRKYLQLDEHTVASMVAGVAVYSRRAHIPWV